MKPDQPGTKGDSDSLVDLRSDTITRPTPGMLEAMFRAEVGDDVLGDDPTVLRLQQRAADLLGKEAGLFVPSGTMGNQIAIHCQTSPGDEVVAHEHSHIYLYEAGAPAVLSGCMLKLLPGRAGMITADQVRSAIRPLDSHFPRTRLVVLENSHNRGGGTVWDLEAVHRIRGLADEASLRMHLDGARLLNACIAGGYSAREFAADFDSVSLCFSKGLGAPVGSVLVGSRSTIERAHRVRKMLGGGMRQAGYLAAAAIYALDHHVERLAEDHAHARRLAEAIQTVPGLSVDMTGVQTNIVYFDVDPKRGSASDLCALLAARNVRMLALGPTTIRAVTHLDVSSSQMDHAIEVLQHLSGSWLRA